MPKILETNNYAMPRKHFIWSFMICLAAFVAPWCMNAQNLHHTNQDLPCVNKNYNLLAHVAVDSTNRQALYSRQILDTMVMKLNEFFSPICVSFSLCDYNLLADDYSLGRIRNQPISTFDRLQELKSRFALRRRINIFFVDYITTASCGTSTFEGILTTNDANIFIERDCYEDLAGQVAHHLGHIFGLRNTFNAGNIELVNGDNCTTTGDMICDTPADPFGQPLSTATAEEIALVEDDLLVASFFNSTCEFIYEIKDPNGEYYQPDMGNIMSAYPCKCGFTQEQFKLMVETILSSDIRHF